MAFMYIHFGNKIINKSKKVITTKGSIVVSFGWDEDQRGMDGGFCDWQRVTWRASVVADMVLSTDLRGGSKFIQL